MQKSLFVSLFIVGVSLLLVRDAEAGNLAMKLASYPYMPIWTSNNNNNAAGVRVETVQEQNVEAPKSNEELERQMQAARAASRRVRYLLDRLYAGRR